ncbi:beta-lactamase family protein [Planctomicrobium sp.]|jgi:N-acyl-D-amino-acid deacylase|nr:serine hydrolase domain-containing protein [Planctomicrobium sp.]MDB4439337.1 beta-lactamase family protein [Planctomicrobium sp.]MDB4733121.1 beta-lactamase family protein [Planctomicrobium sp.]MDB4743189.1 beta-lactamase family protein [Planctomicrobium sp.]
MRSYFAGETCFGNTLVASSSAFTISILILLSQDLRAEEVPTSGNSSFETRSVDANIIEFINKHQVPGMSVAMTVNGELKYARGFGYADVEKQEHVLPTSLFRIASLSKPITAVAILQLVEQKRLSLEDKVFAILDQFEGQIQASGKRFDDRLKAVTIRQLLQHRGGWDRGVSFDPMFQSVRFASELKVPAPASAQNVISSMLKRHLDFEPGERYTYSNFGYCLLGRVVEKISGQTYEEYVQESVLKPLGVKTMRIGKTKLSGRVDSEVRYYHQGRAKSVFQENLGKVVPSAYGGWYLEAMDSHGGWIASATDLVRFASAFDDPARCPILSKQSIDEMFSRPPGKAGFDDKNEPKGVYYSMGWSIRALSNGSSNQWHTGSLPGTTTIMIRRQDGKNFIALLNTRETPSSNSINSDLDQLLHRAANSVKKWPQGNLFAVDDKEALSKK